MGSINLGRVFGSGLLIGIIIDISETILNTTVIGEQWKAAMDKLHLPQTGNTEIIWFMVFGLVLGMVTAFVYAAIRPRFGAGPKTALITAIIVWLLAYLYPALGLMQFHMISNTTLCIGLVWGLVEMVVATLGGCAIYKEEG